MENVSEAKKWCSRHSEKHCLSSCDNCWVLAQGFKCEQHDLEVAFNAGYSACMHKFHNTFRMKQPKSGRYILVWGKNANESDIVLCKTLSDGSCINQLTQMIESYDDEMMWCYVVDIIPRHNNSNKLLKF